MKNKKLKLTDLKVKSFVTEDNDELVKTIKGGARSGSIDNPSDFFTCNGPTPGTHCFICPQDQILR